MKYFSKKGGFTLIELLVVIAIIAILTAIVTANFTQSKAKARDAKRVSDIANLQLTLEMIFDRCNVYPASISSANLNTTICTGSTGITYNLAYFISKLPNPPTSVAGDTYDYAVNDPDPTKINDYVLRAKLETNSTSLSDDIDDTVLTLDCSDTPTAYYYCVVPK
jgi:prepilin-type N-terminal cleavage/methylation domain-containing protein